MNEIKIGRRVDVSLDGDFISSVVLSHCKEYKETDCIGISDNELK